MFVLQLLLIGDSGVGKSCLLLRFAVGTFPGPLLANTFMAQLLGKTIAVLCRRTIRTLRATSPPLASTS